MLPGRLALVAAATISAAGISVAQGMSPPPTESPPLDGVPLVLNPKFSAMKARAIVQRVKRGDVCVIVPNDLDGLMVIDTEVRGDLLVLPADEVVPQKARRCK